MPTGTNQPDPTRRDDRELATRWLAAASDPAVAGELEAIYAMIADAVSARGPACWASGRCCNFARAGHRLYTTGLEAAYTVARAGPESVISAESIAVARAVGGCPFQRDNLCGAHAVRPIGCRVYFCDRAAERWQRDLTERAMAFVRSLHDRHALPYRYAEWRDLLTLLTPAPGPG
ncbi:MAG: hypothetical protein KIT68_02970 [Phycisphaeraceae bacterium]|nr:hypothetical protein [Phycisphaeraceae bacterium]